MPPREREGGGKREGGDRQTERRTDRQTGRQTEGERQRKRTVRVSSVCRWATVSQ